VIDFVQSTQVNNNKTLVVKRTFDIDFFSTFDTSSRTGVDPVGIESSHF